MESQKQSESVDNSLYRVIIRVISIFLFAYAISLCYGNNCTYSVCYGITEDIEEILVAIVYAQLGIALIMISNTIKDE